MLQQFVNTLRAIGQPIVTLLAIFLNGSKKRSAGKRGILNFLLPQVVMAGRSLRHRRRGDPPRR